jgi:predicted RNA-binding Zn-ribbon protein involved in translation (DUF1610 family)
MMASYNVELNGKEISYFLFAKKKCPVCGQKMRREKHIISLGEGFDSVELGKFYEGECNEVKLYYKCPSCNKVYPITELIKKTRII